jgi:hypothetical protein
MRNCLSPSLTGKLSVNKVEARIFGLAGDSAPEEVNGPESANGGVAVGGGW